MSIIPPGWALLPNAAEDMPGGAVGLLRKLQEQKLKAFLQVAPRPNRETPWLREHSVGVDDGKRFEVASRYWNTTAAQTALRGRWVEAPVLEPLYEHKGRICTREVTKGGYILIEESVVKAAYAKGAREKMAAERHLEAEIEHWKAGKAPPPVKTHWRLEVIEKTGVSGKGADDIWRRAVEAHPELGSPKGKPKTKRV